MLNPFFSIVVPIYNAQNTIQRCVESVLAQEMQDFELILVNDGSSDNSLQICKELEINNKNIRVIDKKNGGVSSARNEGIHSSVGKYIVFLDSDDTVSPKLLHSFYKSIMEQNVDLVFCNFSIITKSHRFSNTVDVRKVDSKQDIAMQFENLYNSNLLNCCWGKCFKRELITYQFDSNLRLGEDFLFVLNYLKNTDSIQYIDENLYNYYIFSESTLSFAGGVQRLDNLYEVYTKSMKVLTELFNADCFQYSIERKFCINILDSAERIAKSDNIGKKDKIEVFKEAIENLKNLKYISKALNDIDRKFTIEYKLLIQEKYNSYILICKGIKTLHDFKSKCRI